MKPKLVATSVGIGGIAVVITAWIVMKDPILEMWYIQQLETGSTEEMIGAARNLGRMKSVKAVPSLLIAMKRMSLASGNAIESSNRSPDELFVGPTNFRFEGFDRPPPGYEELQFLFSFHGIGAAAIPGLIEAPSHHDPEISLIAANILDRLARSGTRKVLIHGRRLKALHEVLPTLKSLQKDGRWPEDVGRLAAAALSDLESLETTVSPGK